MATAHNTLKFCKIYLWFLCNKMCIYENTLSMRNCYYNYIKTKHDTYSYSWGKLYVSRSNFGGIVIYKFKLKIEPGWLSLKCGWNFGDVKILNGGRWPFFLIKSSTIWPIENSKCKVLVPMVISDSTHYVIKSIKLNIICYGQGVST